MQAKIKEVDGRLRFPVGIMASRHEWMEVTMIALWEPSHIN